MPRITYVEPDGTRRWVEVEAGLSLMEGAIRNGVAGIFGQCGGACACATCHVHVPDALRAFAGERFEDEAAMLEFAAGVRPDSRLACQIKVVDAMDEMVVYVAAA